MSDENNETPQALTVQQVAEIVNAAITSHMKRQPDPKALIASAIEEFKKTIPAPAPVDDGDTKSGKGGKTAGDAQYAALQAKFDEMTKALAAADQARQNAEKQQRQDRAFSEVKSALVGKVRPEAINDVADLLQARGRIELDDTGTPFIKVKRSPYAGAPEEDTLMPLTDGVDVYLKKEGAIYAPAPGSSTAQAGAAARGSKMPTPALPKGAVPKYDGEAKTDEERVQRAFDMEMALKAQGHG